MADSNNAQSGGGSQSASMLSFRERLVRAASSPPFLFILAAVLVSVWISSSVNPTWVEQKTTYNVDVAGDGSLSYRYKGKSTPIDGAVPYVQSPLRQSELDRLTEAPALERQWVSETLDADGDSTVRYSLLEARFHFGIWSLLPALAAIVLCLITKEALLSLFTGTVVGAFMLGRFDITDAVLIPSLASTSAASVLLLYLWLVGGLLGIWSRTGAAQAFAEFMTLHFVKGPRTAKFVCWMMGVLFFQGGTISVVLVGTIVKPVADKERISHEELAYIVDSTASPIASLIAFNAWPAYVQALIFVPGVSFLATENDRIRFFFDSIPFSFYSLFAVLGTLLLSLGVMQVAGPGLRRARERARSTGELDAPGALPLSAKEIQIPDIPEGYRPGLSEFFLPLLLLISIAVGTFIYTGTPRVNWGFGAALMSAVCLALFNGMSLRNVIEGIGSGLKGVVLASVILLMAVTIGGISQEVGAGIYLVELLGDQISYWMLPVALQLITMVIAFSAGTSWGTYAIAFPLAMPLAWAVAMNSGVGDPVLFMSICFATVLNGSVYGDQCSPISDTTVLSAMTTGCDLMDHVTTQIVPASIAAGLAAILWTVLTVTLV